MTIYATPFRKSDKQCTGPSTDSGFTSINQVIELMGSDYIITAPQLVIYGADENRIIYSNNIIFSVDDNDNNQ